MNVTRGGKNAKPMHNTVIPMDNPNPKLCGKPQSMVYPPGHKHAGKPKGIRDILDERGLLNTLARGARGQPIGVCTACWQSEEAQSKAEKAAQEQMENDPIFYWSLGKLCLFYAKIKYICVCITFMCRRHWSQWWSTPAVSGMIINLLHVPMSLAAARFPWWNATHTSYDWTGQPPLYFCSQVSLQT